MQCGITARQNNANELSPGNRDTDKVLDPGFRTGQGKQDNRNTGYKVLGYWKHRKTRRKV